MPKNDDSQMGFNDFVSGGDGSTLPDAFDQAQADDQAQLTQSTALSAYSADPVFDRSEIVLPRMRLAQGLTAEVQDGSAHPGQWLLTGNDPLDNVTFVPLRMTRRRELRGAGEDRQTVNCSSVDAVIGVGDPGGPCAQCPMADWTTRVDRGREVRVPPPCTFIYSYLGYAVEYDQMVVVEMSKTGIKPAKVLNTIIMQRGLGRFAVSLGSEIKRDGQRTYALPTLKAATVTVDTLAAAHRTLEG